MGQCIHILSDGTVQVTAQAPSECTGYVLLTREEYQEAINPLFQPLSMESGMTIVIAIASLWSIAFIIRLLRGMLINQSGDYES